MKPARWWATPYSKPPKGEKTAEQALKDAADELRRQIDFG